MRSIFKKSPPPAMGDLFDQPAPVPVVKPAAPFVPGHPGLPMVEGWRPTTAENGIGATKQAVEDILLRYPKSKVFVVTVRAESEMEA